MDAQSEQIEDEGKPNPEDKGPTETRRNRPARRKRPTVVPEDQPGDNEGQSESLKSPLPDNPEGKAQRTTPEPEKWTIRGVDRDTRAIIQKAAARSNKSLDQWFNEDLREFAQAQVRKTTNAPGRPGGAVPDRFDQLKSELKAEQLEELKALRKALETRPNNLWEWIRGKKR